MRGAALLIALLSLAFSSSMTWAAGTLEIAPTTLNLMPGEAGLLYVKNNSAAPVAMQIQPMDWKQNGNADVLSESSALIASPPFLRIAPGERQIVRVFAAPREPEADYRLVMSELPNPAHRASVVNVLLQFNIPVFVTAEPQKPQTVWSAEAGNGGLLLRLQNTGTSAVKLDDFSVSKDIHSPAARGLIYVLPGARHEWRLPDDGSASVQLSARDARSGVSLDADIPVQR